MTRYAFPDPPADSSGDWTVTLPGDAAIGEVILYATAAAAPPAGDYVAAVLADNPIGYWQLAETSGTTADEEISGRDGTYMDDFVLDSIMSPAGTPAPSFPGGFTDWGEVLVNDHDVWSLGLLAEPFTIECIIEPAITAFALPRMLVAKDSTTTDREYIFYLTRSGGSGPWHLNFQVFTTDGDLYTEGDDLTVPEDEWSHVAVTYDPTGAPRLLLYVNGESIAATVTDTGATMSNTGAALKFAARGDAQPRALGGHICHVAIYDYRLTPTQLATHVALLDFTP